VARETMSPCPGINIQGFYTQDCETFKETRKYDPNTREEKQTTKITFERIQILYLTGKDFKVDNVMF
jgi:hypothetical protein